MVIDSDGKRLTVTGLGLSEQDVTAFNLTVAGLHTYYVGSESVLVHNCGGMTEFAGENLGKRGFPNLRRYSNNIDDWSTHTCSATTAWTPMSPGPGCTRSRSNVTRWSSKPGCLVDERRRSMGDGRRQLHAPRERNPGESLSGSQVSVVIRLRIGSPNEHWRDEPWVYAKALKWFEEEDDAIAESERLNTVLTMIRCTCTS